MNMTNKKYIVTQWLNEYDYDGMSSDFKVLGEFNELQAAKNHSTTSLEAIIETRWALKTDWGLMEIDWKTRPVLHDPNEGNLIFFSQAKKIGDGTGYNSLYVYIDVIEIAHDTIIDTKLFNPEKCELEVRRFFQATAKLEEAKVFVKERIKGVRKGLYDVPAYTHSLRVCALLEKQCWDKEVVLAGLLHDIIEDGGATTTELSEEGYSERTIRLVELCTHPVEVENKTSRWLLMIAKLIQADDQDAWMIKLADLTDNLSESKGLTPENRKFMVETKAPILLRLTEDDPMLQSHRHALDVEMRKQQEEIKKMEVSIGDWLYIDTELYIGHGVDDIRGGLAKVKSIKDGMVEFEGFDGSFYSLKYLLPEQEKLELQFGKQHAYPDPDYRAEFND